MESLIAFLSGGVFGFALDKGKTNVPYVVSEQMELNNFIMMRMFFAASATSTAALMISHKIGIQKREARTSIALGFGRLGGYGGNFVGGLLLGAGMYLTGSCPGTVWAQLPLEHAVTNISLLLGGITGSIFYGYLEKQLRENVPDYQKRGKVEDADLVPKSMSYTAASIAFVGACALLLYGVEQVFPWREEVGKILVDFDPKVRPSNPVALDALAWDPAIAGLLVGLLQFPMHVSSAGALGMSTGWVLIASNLANLFDVNLEKNAPYLHKNLKNSHASFQLTIAAGVFAGVSLSQYLSGYPAISMDAKLGANIAGDGLAGHLTAFFGAALLLIGARIQAGCTSGHGLSGLSTLSLASLISVGGMFAGGMTLGLMFDKVIPMIF